MRIAVCDDELHCRRQLADTVDCITKSLDVVTVAFEDGSALLHAFRENPFDLVFLDIEMPDMDGITLARELRRLSADVPVVFLTAHIEYALEGYEVNALRYLTKPVQPDKLREVIDHVTARMQEQRTIWIKTDSGDLRLPVSEIICFEAQNQNILIRTDRGEYSVRYNLSDYESELGTDGFFRVHRSYIVSLRKIQRVEKGQVVLSGDVHVPVSRTREKELKEALFSCVREGAI